MPEDQKWLRCRVHHQKAGASILLSIVKDANLLGVRSRIQKKENSLWSPVELPCPMLSCALYLSCQAATSCLTSSQHGKRVELLTQCVWGAGLGWNLKCSYSFIRTITHNDNGIDRCWGKAWTARCLIILTSNWSLSQQLNCPLLTTAPLEQESKMRLWLQSLLCTACRLFSYCQTSPPWPLRSTLFFCSRSLTAHVHWLFQLILPGRSFHMSLKNSPQSRDKCAIGHVLAQVGIPSVMSRAPAS